MKYKAIIKYISFSPKVSCVQSLVHLSVNIPQFGSTIWLLQDEIGSIKSLSQKLGFNIINEQNWDFRNLINRKCLVEKVEGGYRFVSYL